MNRPYVTNSNYEEAVADAVGLELAIYLHSVLEESQW